MKRQITTDFKRQQQMQRKALKRPFYFLPRQFNFLKYNVYIYWDSSASNNNPQPNIQTNNRHKFGLTPLTIMGKQTTTRLQRAPEDVLREQQRLPPKLTKEETIASYRFEEREVKRAHKKMHSDVMKGKHKTLLSYFVDANGLATKKHDKKKKAFLRNQRNKAKRLEKKFTDKSKHN